MLKLAAHSCCADACMHACIGTLEQILPKVTKHKHFSYQIKENFQASQHFLFQTCMRQQKNKKVAQSNSFKIRTPGMQADGCPKAWNLFPAQMKAWKYFTAWSKQRLKPENYQSTREACRNISKQDISRPTTAHSQCALYRTSCTPGNLFHQIHKKKRWQVSLKVLTLDLLHKLLDFVFVLCIKFVKLN